MILKVVKLPFLFAIALLSSQHTAAMEHLLPTPEPAESVEWCDDAPNRHRTNWHLPHVSRRNASILLCALLASGAAAQELPLAELAGIALSQVGMCPESHVLTDNLEQYTEQASEECATNCVLFFVIEPIEAFFAFDGSIENCALGCIHSLANNLLQCAVPGT